MAQHSLEVIIGLGTECQSQDLKCFGAHVHFARWVANYLATLLDCPGYGPANGDSVI